MNPQDRWVWKDNGAMQADLPEELAQKIATYLIMK